MRAGGSAERRGAVGRLNLRELPAVRRDRCAPPASGRPAVARSVRIVYRLPLFGRQHEITGERGSGREFNHVAGAWHDRAPPGDPRRGDTRCWRAVADAGADLDRGGQAPARQRPRNSAKTRISWKAVLTVEDGIPEIAETRRGRSGLCGRFGDRTIDADHTPQRMPRKMLSRRDAPPRPARSGRCRRAPSPLHPESPERPGLTRCTATVGAAPTELRRWPTPTP